MTFPGEIFRKIGFLFCGYKITISSITLLLAIPILYYYADYQLLTYDNMRANHRYFLYYCIYINPFLLLFLFIKDVRQDTKNHKLKGAYHGQ